MNNEALSDLEVFKATLMVLSDSPTKPVDTLFFHGRSYRDDDGLFEIAGNMYQKKSIGTVTIANNEGERYGSEIPFESNPGKTEYRKRLLGQGVLAQDIVCPSRGAYNTIEESRTFIELAKLRGWRDAVILTQPHQALRAMLGTINVMKTEGYQMYVAVVVPRRTDWGKVVRGSQGIESKSRAEHIKDELDRIRRYQEKGDLSSFSELYEYLRIRDSREISPGL